MGSKKPSKRTAQPSQDNSGEQWRDVVIATLRETVGVLRAQLEAQSKLLASKDLQIQMVLEDRFFRPTFERDPSPAIANTKIDGATLTDSTQFPTEGDKKVLAEQDQELEKTRAALQAELDDIDADQNGSIVEELEARKQAVEREIVERLDEITAT